LPAKCAPRFTFIGAGAVAERTLLARIVAVNTG
jgi:hypothetical protein